MITNKLNLPQPLVDAVANDPYDKGASDFSATELIAPPYLKALYRQHKDALEVDASDRIWSLLGQAVHGVLERAGTGHWVVEKRCFATFPFDGKDYLVSAQIDVLDTQTMTLSDYKCTSVYKFKRGYDGAVTIPPEYEQQLNIQAECVLVATGRDVEKAQIVGILRDWRQSEKNRESGYPPFKVEIMDIPIWPRAKRREFILERIALHLHASPEPCSPFERWDRPDVYALVKDGQKRALRLYDDKAPAEKAMLAYGGGVSITHRPGKRVRCEGYCEVAAKCPSFQEYLKNKENE